MGFKSRRRIAKEPLPPPPVQQGKPETLDTESESTILENLISQTPPKAKEMVAEIEKMNKSMTMFTIGLIAVIVGAITLVVFMGGCAAPQIQKEIVYVKEPKPPNLEKPRELQLQPLEWIAKESLQCLPVSEQKKMLDNLGEIQRYICECKTQIQYYHTEDIESDATRK